MIYIFFLLCMLPIISFTKGFFLESKHFASVYAINENNIIPCGFGTKEITSIHVPHTIHCADSLLKERTESIIYATKEHPDRLYDVDIQRRTVTELVILHNEKVPLFVHGISTNQHLIFLALSSDPVHFDTPESRIACFVIQSTKEQEPKLLPFSQEIKIETIKKISKSEEAKIVFKKMYVNAKTQRLFFCFDVIKQDDTGIVDYCCYDYMVSFLQQDKEKNMIEWVAPECSGVKNYQKATHLLDSAIMQTSTALSYMIFLSQDVIRSQVIAAAVSPEGVITHKKNKCDNLFFIDGLKRFTGRYFIQEKKETGALTQSDDYEFLVGNNDFSVETPVKKIKILGDTIFFITKNEVFGSTALFDKEGRIRGWSDWKKYMYQETEIDDIEIDRFTGQYLILTENRIVKSVWHTYSYNNIDNPFRAVVTKVDTNIEEIQLYAIDAHTCYHLKINKECTGVEKNICTTVPDVGELISLHSYYDKKAEKNYFLIAGREGISQISFTSQETVENVLKISSIGKIKKIIIDQEMMYLLSSSCLYRIVLKQNKSLQENFLDAELLIDTTKQTDFGFLTDIIISDACVLLAAGTRIWLLKEGSIKKGIPQFVQAHFPESIGIPVSFFVQSVTGKETDFARFCAANVFVLFCDVVADQSKLYRLSIEPTSKGEIKFDTVSFFNDVILRNKPTSFLNFSSAQSSFFTDGIRYLLPSTGKQVSLFPQPTLGVVWSGNKLHTFLDRDGVNSHILYSGLDELSGNVLISTAHELYIHT